MPSRTHRRRGAVALGAALCAGLLLATGGSSGRAAAQPRLWVAGPYVKLQPTTRPVHWRPALVAPRGGRASFQIVVDGGPRARPVALGLESPRAVLPARAVGISRELWVPVTAGSSALAHALRGDIPDPLVPTSVRPQAGTRQQFWVTIAIPRNQPPGLYRGAVRIGRRSVRFSLRVADVTLPRRHALNTWFLVWGKHADAAEHRAGAAGAYTRLLARYGIGDGTPAGGDAAVGLQPDSLAGDQSDATLRALAQRVGAAARRLHARMPSAAPYSYVFDEPPAGQLEQVRRWGAALQLVAPSVRQLVTAKPDPSLGRTVGAWAMHIGALTPSALAATRSVGAQAWVYSSCCESRGSPTLLLDQSAVGNLALAPATWLQGASGLLYWSVDDYTADPYRDAQNHDGDAGRISNGDGVLLYPGRPLGLAGPAPSMRLALTAAGLQIADEAALLSRLGHRGEARAILSRALRGTASFAPAPAAWLAVEPALLRAIERAS